MRRFTTIPGVGAITAASVKAFVPDPGDDDGEREKKCQETGRKPLTTLTRRDFVGDAPGPEDSAYDFSLARAPHVWLKLWVTNSQG
jgi:hypothetical protein